MPATQTKRKKNNFIDNKKFYAALTVYHEKCAQAKANKESRPPVPRYVGDCFLKIATHLAMRPNFSQYIFKEDMIMDAVENMVVYAYNFDPKKSKNPFSYFTQIAWYAFIRKIGKEKQQLKIWEKLVTKSDFTQFFSGDDKSYSEFNSIVDEVDQRRRSNK